MGINSPQGCETHTYVWLPWNIALGTHSSIKLILRQSIDIFYYYSSREILSYLITKKIKANKTKMCVFILPFYFQFGFLLFRRIFRVPFVFGGEWEFDFCGFACLLMWMEWNGNWMEIILSISLKKSKIARSSRVLKKTMESKSLENISKMGFELTNNTVPEKKLVFFMPQS